MYWMQHHTDTARKELVQQIIVSVKANRKAARACHVQRGSKASHLCTPLVLSMRLQGVLSNNQGEVMIDPVWHALCESLRNHICIRSPQVASTVCAATTALLTCMQSLP